MKITKHFVFKVLSLLSLVAALVLEALPNGVACVFMTKDKSEIIRYYSYFDSTPFGNADFAPLITAVRYCLRQPPLH